MLATLASSPGNPGKRNDDWAATTTSGLAILLDGLTEVGGQDCRHGTGWYVHQLGTRLLTLADPAGDMRSLAEVLATGLAEVARLHDDTCRPTGPTAPGATVAMLRLVGTCAEYLVLSDAFVIIDTGPAAEPLVVTDQAVRAHAGPATIAASAAAGTDDGLALHALIRTQQQIRNQPGGYWVAQADPAAADHARVGTLAAVTGALLLSDGAALLASDFDALTWRELLDLGYAAGPNGIIAATRELESRDPQGQVWPRYKCHDDATAVVCRP